MSTLIVQQGGTGSDTSLTNGKLMVSSGGAIVEVDPAIVTQDIELTGDFQITGELTIDNITLNGNTISTTNDLNLSGGTGKVDIQANTDILLTTNVGDIYLDAQTGSGSVYIQNGTTLDCGTSVIDCGQLNADNLRLDGNVLSSTNTDGDIVLTPNGTGKVITDDIELAGNTITALSTQDLLLTADGSTVNNIILTHGALGSVKVNKLVGRTSTTSIDLDKLTIDTGTTDVTTLTSSDTNNRFYIDGGSGAARIYIKGVNGARCFCERSSTSGEAGLNLWTAGVQYWNMGLENTLASNDFALLDNSNRVLFRCGASSTNVYFAYAYDAVANDRAAYYEANGQIGTTSSLRAHKMNIEDIGDCSWFYQLTFRDFYYKKTDEDGNFLEEAKPWRAKGLIVDEIPVEAESILIYDNPETKENPVDYRDRNLLAVIGKCVQDLNTRLTALEGA